MRFITPRLRKPLLRAIAGLGIAGAWAIGGGAQRWLAIVIAICFLGYAVGWYVWAGQDTDEGALLGSRADERQKLVGQKARALAGVVAMAGAYAGLVITLAVKRDDAWPFAVMLLGTLLVAGGGRWMVLFPVMLVLLEIKIRIEERLMLAEFPDEYPRYRQLVPKLVPRLRLLSRHAGDQQIAASH
jgi:hypothetical protein